LKVKYIILGISALFLLIGFGVPGELEASGSEIGARIITSMGQMRSDAETEKENTGSYEGIHCDNADNGVKALCDDIESFVGIWPIIHQSKDAYCAYTVLPTSDDFYCIDSPNFASVRVKNFPDQQGYCDGITFLCVVGDVEPPEFRGDSSYVSEYLEAIESIKRRETISAVLGTLVLFVIIILPPITTILSLVAGIRSIKKPERRAKVKGIIFLLLSIGFLLLSGFIILIFLSGY